MPVRLDADNDAIPLIEPPLFKTNAFEYDAAPGTVPAKNPASAPILYPAIDTEDNDPTDVIFGCAPV